MKISALPPFIIIGLLCMTLSCKKKDNNETTPFTKDGLHGYSQKGPFVNGSTLTIYELDASYTQTGNSFNTQIKDNLGTFELPGISLQSSYAKLKADGFYFNEIKNANSASPITLYAF
jgi:hypothetical protein